ncbi:hypothetical protein SK3146_05850 [Paenibacillus konkukensis]|uniref:Uncharacterized protein n=2 Tax=Paenibacillus konkukensis TaxID=2020716 RepID=A0ABY4RYS3_9BACL|nr:hypothetical protein [Paenibacillus doosanensis]UQZ86557.1 hypothetical protein SK3146_05850 [Paenibacillus konkukensis]
MVKIIVHGALLIAKTPGLWLGFVRERRSGARAFETELLSFGMEPEQAAELAQCYKTMFMPKWKDAFRNMKRISGDEGKKFHTADARTKV